jgi:alkylation response protein AidB-like acyl-CoA dehydrogenase
MDLTFSEEQQAIHELAGRILTDKLPPERLRDIEITDPDRFARDVWEELAKSELLGIGLPADVGGGGYGFLETCLVLEQVGRTVAPVPAYATLVLGALPIAEFGDAAQRAAWLPGVCAGQTVLTAALVESGDGVPPVRPAATAVPVDAGWELSGEKWFVPAASVAAAVLVPATLPDGSVAVFLVDPTAAGVTLTALDTFSGEPQSTVSLERVVVAPDRRLGGEAADGAAIVAWITERAVAATCITQAGVVEGALRITAAYVSQREQFNAKLATFQAVSQRTADAYVDTELVRLTAWQAAWRLANGLDAREATAIAKFFTAEAAQRVVHAAQHLHGGIGLDLDYPVHRYFRWAKELELRLGGGVQHLVPLGAMLAASC